MEFSAAGESCSLDSIEYMNEDESCEDEENKLEITRNPFDSNLCNKVCFF